MGIKLGRNCKIYRNSGTDWAAPTWDKLLRVKDNTLDMTADEADVSTRDSLFNLAANAGITAAVDFQIQFDDTTSAKTQRDALRAAFLAGTSVELAIMDGDITVAGTEGLHADFAVLKFTRNEALKDALVYDVSVKPTLTANDPEWLIVEEETTTTTTAP